MNIKNKTELLIALLYANNQQSIEGITRLEKILFLLKKEAGFLATTTEDKNFNFVPFKMGPWSQEVYDELDFLDSLDLLNRSKSRKHQEEDLIHNDELFDSMILDKYQKDELEYYNNSTEKFQLSEKGQNIAKKLWTKLKDDEKNKIQTLKSKYNKMNLKQFLRYVYAKYPQYASKSEIKEYLRT